MARIDAFFKLMSEEKASDLHLATNNPPMLRINGELVRVDYPPLQNDELKAIWGQNVSMAHLRISCGVFVSNSSERRSISLTENMRRLYPV